LQRKFHFMELIKILTKKTSQIFLSLEIFILSWWKFGGQISLFVFYFRCEIFILITGIKFHILIFRYQIFPVSNFKNFDLWCHISIFWFRGSNYKILISGIKFQKKNSVKLHMKNDPFLLYGFLITQHLLEIPFCITNNTQTFICCWTNS